MTRIATSCEAAGKGLFLGGSALFLVWYIVAKTLLLVAGP
jgi:hypothetical protein